MEIKEIPFQKVNWSEVEAVEYKGETGTSFWKTIQVGNMRIRMVDYGAGYLADHWCSKGHILLTLTGEFVLEFENGEKCSFKEGESFQVADNLEPHRVFTEKGAIVFIVD